MRKGIQWLYEHAEEDYAVDIVRGNVEKYPGQALIIGHTEKDPEQALIVAYPEKDTDEKAESI